MGLVGAGVVPGTYRPSFHLHGVEITHHGETMFTKRLCGIPNPRFTEQQLELIGQLDTQIVDGIRLVKSKQLHEVDPNFPSDSDGFDVALFAAQDGNALLP